MGAGTPANRTFFSVGKAKRAITPLVQDLNQKEMQHLGKSRKQLFEELDQPAMSPLPKRPYEYAAWKMAKVNIDYNVAYERHFYSIPHALAEQEVRIRAKEILISLQTLDDQLHELRLSTFPTALREQQANPQYTELSFEDHLALLVKRNVGM